MNKHKHLVLDLDDTIYKEIDFVRSAYNYIIAYIKLRYNKDFNFLIEETIKQEASLYKKIMANSEIDFTLMKFLELYRFHFPNIFLDEQTKLFFDTLDRKQIDFSIITDGRSITQRNKIHALGLCKKVKKIIISEETGCLKLSNHNFEIIEKAFPNKDLIYIGDNTSKDFYSPNILGWKTICLLDDGKNIHNQSFDIEKKYLPNSTITNLNDLF